MFGSPGVQASATDFIGSSATTITLDPM